MENEETRMLAFEHRQTFIGDGVRLEIVATEIEEETWSLAIVNEFGVSSNWYDLFKSKDCAVEAALSAIREEGVLQFQDIEGFEYLQDDGL